MIDEIHPKHFSPPHRNTVRFAPCTHELLFWDTYNLYYICLTKTNSSIAPIDIDPDIIKQYKERSEEAYKNAEVKDDSCVSSYYQGKFDACDEILSEFDEFKKLFS